MLLTQERADKLSEILNADAAQAKELLELEPKEAATRINALGHDFTAEELKEYGSTLRNNLSDSALAGVAGGVGGSASEDDISTRPSITISVIRPEIISIMPLPGTLPNIPVTRPALGVPITAQPLPINNVRW